MTMIRYKYNDTCRIERQKLGERKHGIHRDIPIKEAYNAVVAENGRYLIYERDKHVSESISKCCDGTVLILSNLRYSNFFMLNI